MEVAVSTNKQHVVVAHQSSVEVRQVFEASDFPADVLPLRSPRARTRSASRCGGMLPDRSALVVSAQERRQLVECLTPSALAVAGQVAAVEDDELIRHEQLGLSAAR